MPGAPRSVYGYVDTSTVAAEYFDVVGTQVVTFSLTAQPSLSALAGFVDLYLYDQGGHTVAQASVLPGPTAASNVVATLATGRYKAQVSAPAYGNFGLTAQTLYAIGGTTADLGTDASDSGTFGTIDGSVIDLSLILPAVTVQTPLHPTAAAVAILATINQYGGQQYQFILDTPTTLNLLLEAGTAHVQSTASMTLETSAGGIVTTVPSVPGRDGLISDVLAAGTYNLLISTSALGDTPITLTYSAGAPVVSTAATDLAGNTAATARDIGTPGPMGTTYSDWIGPGDPDDFYRFSLANPSVFRLVANGLVANATFTITDASGAPITTASTGAQPGVAIVQQLRAGTYFIDASSAAATGYNLTVNAITIPDQAGNTQATADTTALTSGGPLVSDFVGPVDPDDYYTFTLPTPATIDLNVDTLGKGTTLTLFDAGGALLAGGHASTSSYPLPNTPVSHAQALVHDLPAGTYAVDVGNAVNPADYTLSLMTQPLSYTYQTPAFAALGVPAHNDFNGDGKSDLLWQSADGTIVDWSMNGASVASAATVGALGPDWSLIGTGDFNGDGKTDLLWQRTDGQIVDWTMNGGVALSGDVVATLDHSWTLLGTGDTNGDGNTDLIWRNTANQVVDWAMSGSRVIGATTLGTLGSDWTLLGTGDLKNDGKSDLLWQQAGTGTIVAWDMFHSTVLGSATIGALDASWKFLATADFDGDGKSDLLWQQQGSGTIVAWKMDGATIVGGAGHVLGALGSDWSFVSAGDLDGDGRADIVWRQTGGAIVDWTTNGQTVTSGTPVGTLDGSWKHLG